MATELGIKEDIVSALKCMADIYKFFGNNLKSIHLLQQANSLEPQEETKDDESVVPFSIIKKHGVLTANELEIKTTIQVEILDKITQAAANGKWHNEQLFNDYGVAGYIEESYLNAILGEALITPENIQIALALCFEAVNLGIMQSSAKNPLCAAIFAQQYPEIVANILETHPDYFVDGFILETTIVDAHEYSPSLVGHPIAENDSYNKAFEAAITPFVEARIQDSVLTPITTLITKNEWNSSIQKQLLTYFTEEYLTTTIVGNSYLGQNLSTVTDVISIVRILGFQTINAAIKATKSTNYAPVEAFITMYPELTARIMTDHQNYFANDETIRIYQDNASKANLFDSHIVVVNDNESPVELTGDFE